MSYVTDMLQKSLKTALELCHKHVLDKRYVRVKNKIQVVTFSVTNKTSTHVCVYIIYMCVCVCVRVCLCVCVSFQNKLY